LGRWHGPFAEDEKSRALAWLEEGRVLHFPALAFRPEEDGDLLFASVLADNRNKNISYEPVYGSLKGTAAAGRERQALLAMMTAFSAAATGFIGDLLPRYIGGLEPGRASYRPVEIVGREYSPLKDDKRLHIDAFPSTPTRGRRILRLFCNINPSGKPRLWHIGEAFEQHAAQFLPALGPPRAAAAWLLAVLGATRGRRSAYDQLMLGLHDSAKRDAAYQAEARYQQALFAAGSTWLCFTDQVVHAALAGQYALEHTFYVPVEAMADLESAPLRILERLTGRKLV
jgi:3-deoxy-D-manno-oct-2-ulosonic acid (Kdo) hydroxylase